MMRIVSRLLREEELQSKILPAMLSSASNNFLIGNAASYMPNSIQLEMDISRSRRTFCTQSNGDQVPHRSYEGMDYQQPPNSTIRRRPYNLEAKMRMKQYRREAVQRQRAQEIEDEERNFQIDWSKLYEKDDPGTVQGVIREINTVGYFVKLPNGREGFLPCAQLGCTGGIPLLSRLFKVGDEVTVRVQQMNDGGKDKVYARKDETLGWAQMA